MSKFKLNRRKLPVALVIAVIALFQCIQLSTSARPLARVAADLTAEKQTLTSFSDSLGSFESKVSELRLKSSITSTELNSAKTSASTLKTKVSQIQQTFQSVINKLKASGEWENFDAIALKQITDPKGQELIRDAGGAKKLLEVAASQLGGLSLEIDALIQPLNSKVASTGSSFGNKAMLGFVPVRASFTASAPVTSPAPAAGESAACRFRKAVYSVTGSDRAFNYSMCICLKDQFPNDGPVQAACRMVGVAM
jgi:hypothetical protein